ncbi:hypothetical protein SAMN04488029_1254 [Reichenbachiella faecimaris]|uniref:Uncharacterized protein n=1 Tax=Reichenbachiella faecimaris TaxID=692418 RepID=A0A1W2G8R9_REIFA|nr:cache domain-containing protein [Reichenbachiella faecimaris]SMD32894.1 hypothetical protein SAMN04488029_1254 [Reichenbachiella faecimaris]
MAVKNKWWALFPTLILISVVFMYYFFVYVKSNEKELVLNNMRVLLQTNKNIESRLNSLYKISQSKLNEILYNKGENTSTGEFKHLEDAEKPSKDTLYKISHGSVIFYYFDGSCAYTYQQDIKEIFANPLIHREDVFDFITIRQFSDEGQTQEILYTNSTVGGTRLQRDSSFFQFKAQSFFEINLGYEDYVVFNSLLRGENNIYLTGFVNKSKFNERKREVSVFTITLITILIIMMIISLPLLKLRVMSNLERLHISDIFLTGISIVMGTAILLILFLFYSSNLIYEQENQERKLGRLADRVSDGFYQELDSMLDRMKFIRNQTDNKLDILHSSDQMGGKAKLESIDFLKDFELGHYDAVSNFFCLKNAHLSWEDYGYANLYFWTDSKARMKIQLSPRSEVSKTGPDLSHRSYVMDIINKEPIVYSRESLSTSGVQDKDTIAIESIRSVLDGTYEIAIGIPSGNEKYPVLARSGPFVTLIDPIMEIGYGFCIFDENGNTLFHSDKTRNLNENFLDETYNTFDPFIESGVSHFTSVMYAGLNHYVRVLPMKNLPGLYMAAFVDHQYIRSPNVIAMNVTISMQVVFYIFITCFFFVIYLLTSKRSKLKQRIFPFNWLRPYYDSDGKYERIYLRLLSTNLLAVIYLILSFFTSGHNPDTLIFSLLFVVLLLIAVHYLILATNLPYEQKIHTLFSISNRYKTLYLLAIGLLLLGFLGYGAHTLRAQYEDWIISIPFWVSLVVLLLLLGLLFYPLIKELYTSNSAATENKKNPYKFKKFTIYKYYALSWVLILSILPPLTFFTINFKKEKEILYKTNILSIKRKNDQWEKVKLDNYYEPKQIPKKQNINDPHGLVGKMKNLKILNPDSLVFVNSEQVEIKPDDRLQTARFVIPKGYNILEFGAEKEETKSGLFGDYYGAFRFYFDNYGVMSQGYIPDVDRKGNWSYAKGGIYFNDSKMKISTPPQSLASIIYPHCGSHVIFLLVLLLATYRVMEYAVQRIFGLDFKNYVDHLISDKRLDDFTQEIVEITAYDDQKISSFNNCLIISVNSSHLFQIREKIKNERADRFVCLDLFDLDNQAFENSSDQQKKGSGSESEQVKRVILNMSNFSNEKKGHKLLEEALNHDLKHVKEPILLYIEHFEYAYNDLVYNRKRMLILQRMVDNPSIRVVISSEINPKKIYQFYQGCIQSLEKNLAKSTDGYMEIKSKLDEIMVDYKKWMHLMGGFYKMTIPLEIIESGADGVLEEGLHSELSNGVFLDRIKWRYTGAKASKEISKEDFTLNVQEISSSYYFSIWNSLSQEERHIVYDIAKDKYVNTNNTDGIIELLHKGILKYDHSLRLVNESFTNFVLSEVNSNEALEKELESNKKGKWSVASSVIILVIISSIVFVSFGKVSGLSDINALVSSLGAIFALFLRISGLVTLGAKTT